MRRANLSLSVDDLIVYCVGEITRSGEECTFERLVFECFTRFPSHFSFQRYPQWPDAVRINKSWLRCRTDKGWIVGSVKEGFRLTDAGEHVANRVRMALGHGDAAPALRQRPRERYEAMLQNLRSHEVFRRYVEHRETLEASPMEIRQLLGATMETPLRVIRQNIQAHSHAARMYDDAQVFRFLEACRGLVAELS